MQLDFPQAMRPFDVAEVSILAAGAGRGDAADAVRVAAASVRAGSPVAQGVGDAAAGEQWVVAFDAAAWVSHRRISRGCVVEADRLSGRWPRLTVQRHQVLAGRMVLECSAREQGRRP